MSYGNGEYLLTNTSNYGGALQKKKKQYLSTKRTKYNNERNLI